MKSLSLNLGVFLAGLAIFSYAEVWGEGWREFDRNDVEIGYYYVHSVRHLSDKIVRVWVKMEYTDKGLIEKFQKLSKNYENLKGTSNNYQFVTPDSYQVRDKLRPESSDIKGF